MATKIWAINFAKETVIYSLSAVIHNIWQNLWPNRSFLLYLMYPSILGCQTVSKKPCLIPFLYKSNTYHGCTYEKESYPWCAVSRTSAAPSWGNNDPDLKNVPYYNEWEECSDECVGEDDLSRYVSGVIFIMCFA